MQVGNTEKGSVRRVRGMLGACSGHGWILSPTNSGCNGFVERLMS